MKSEIGGSGLAADYSNIVRNVSTNKNFGIEI